MDLAFGPDRESPARSVDTAPSAAPAVAAAPHHELVSRAFDHTFEQGASVETAFWGGASTHGFDAALVDLRAGAFGKARADAQLGVPQLADAVRVAREIDNYQAGGQSGGPSQGVDGPLNWVMGVLQGDFNQNPTLSQTVANAFLTMIPGVDQIADVRDIVANLIHIRANPRSSDAWVGLTLTLAGLVPTVGSAAKGAARLALDRRSGAAAFEALRHLGVEQPGRFLAEQARSLGTTVARQFDEVIGGVADTLSFLGRFNSNLAAAAVDVRGIQRQAPTYLTRAVADVEARLAHVANRTPSRVTSPTQVSRALAEFTPRRFHIAGHDLVLSGPSMRHILTRHHPDFWDGSSAARQTFFDKRMTMDSIQEAVGSVLR